MMENRLVHLNQARQALAFAKSIHDVKDIRDRAEALRAYASQAGMGLEMQNECAEIKLRAERRAGELLAEQVRAGNPQLFHHVTIGLEELGITRIQSHRWQLETSVPGDIFERYIAEVNAQRDELTSIGLIRLALRLRKEERAPTVPLPDQKYRCIVIDPPWPIEKRLRSARPNQLEVDYAVMSIDEIMAFPLPELACKDGCHVYLWTTHRFLPVAFEVMEYWGVRYECLLTWIKETGYTPYTWMYSTEHCLFGRVGSLPLLRVGKRLDFEAPAREHSRKPDKFYDLVKHVSPAPRIDVFSREKRDGFEQYGNEITKFQRASHEMSTV